nr:protein rep [Agrobacterium tumefaciens]
MAHSPAEQQQPDDFPKRNVDINSGPQGSDNHSQLWAPSQLNHRNVLEANTGWEIDPISWADRAIATGVLEAQTKRIAEALTRAGEDVVRDGDITLISAVTGVVEELPVYSACRILPTVAARDRRPMVNGLKLFMSLNKKSRYFRYAVFTSAEPVPTGGELREAIQALSRRISKWAHKISKPRNEKGYDIDVLFRGIEFTRGTAKERGMTDRYPPDTILYHVHANVIYWPTRLLSDDDWKEFLETTHKFMGAQWKDNGSIRKVEEIVKYCSKPADTLAASDDEIVWLYRQTKLLKIAQPLGNFKEWMKDLKDRGEKVVRVNVNGEGDLRRVKKFTRKGEPDDENAASDFNEPSCSIDAEEKTIGGQDRKETSKPASNILIGMTLPQWRHTPWAEPMIIVQHYDAASMTDDMRCDIEIWRDRARGWWDEAGAPDPEEALFVAEMALNGHKTINDVREAAEAAKAAEAPSYKVHTCSSTVSRLDSIPYQEPHETIFEDQIPDPEISIRSILDAPNARERIAKIATDATVLQQQSRKAAEDRLTTLPAGSYEVGKEFIDREFPLSTASPAQLLRSAMASDEARLPVASTSCEDENDRIFAELFGVSETDWLAAA